MRQIPLRLWLLALLSGLLQVLPFPIAGPTPLWRTAFCWVAVVPLLAAFLSQDNEGKPLSLFQATLLGYASGIVWYAGNCYWIYQTMYLYGGLAKPVAAGILVLFCLYLGLYHALFGALIGLFRKSKAGIAGALLLSPFAWVAVELACARITSFPWDQMGIAQVDNHVLTRLAPWTGVYGISFVILAVNALLAAAFLLHQERWRWKALVAGAALAILLQSGVLKKPPVAPTTANASLLQENLEVGDQNIGPQMSEGQMLALFTPLSEHPTGAVYLGMPGRNTPLVKSESVEHFDLIVWPEAPAPFQDNDGLFQHWLSALAQDAHAALIVDCLGVDFDKTSPRGYRLYNSAAFVTPEGQFAGRYDKMHLVPFGEYVPYKNLFFFAKNLTQEAGDFDHGQHRIVFRTDGHTYGVFICYESIFADEVRQFVNEGAKVLVNVSNDGWYGDTSAPWQHLNMARMRAIENHRWLLRSTNTGVTASIDPNGRVEYAAPRHVRTAVAVRFAYESDLTFYTRYGDIFAYFCVALTAVFVLLAGLQRYRFVNAPIPLE
ncbi:MAG: apolipoprotein N-acyltransferase [Acidobacteriaceae bacterium]